MPAEKKAGELSQDEDVLVPARVALIREDGRRTAVKHFSGNAIRYGETERQAETFILLKNVYTLPGELATHRILGRLKEENGTRGVEWIEVPRKTGKFFQKDPTAEIPVLLAHLAAEKHFRSAFESELKEVFPNQYRIKKKHGKDDDDDDDDDELSILSGASSHTSRYSEEVANAIDGSPEFQVIYSVGRRILSGENEEEDLKELKPRGGGSKFIPIPMNLSEKRLVLQWLRQVKKQLPKGHSSNRVLENKFLKARKLVGYKFEEFPDEDSFKEVIREVFPAVTRAELHDEFALAVAEGEENASAEPWKKKLAQLKKAKQQLAANSSASTSSGNSSARSSAGSSDLDEIAMRQIDLYGASSGAAPVSLTGVNKKSGNNNATAGPAAVQSLRPAGKAITVQKTIAQPLKIGALANSVVMNQNAHLNVPTMKRKKKVESFEYVMKKEKKRKRVA